MKYLGIYLDEHLTLEYYVNVLCFKLRRTNGALSKLRHLLCSLRNVNWCLLCNFQQLPFELNACQAWCLSNNSVLRRMLTLEKSAIRLITLSLLTGVPGVPSCSKYLFFDLPKTKSRPNMENIKILEI